MNATEVTTGKLGGVFRAPAGTTLPTDATTTLASTFKNIGEVSEDGITKSYSYESEEIKNMNGAVVLTVQTSKNVSFAFKDISLLNIDAMKAVYGADNVTGTLADGLAIQENDDEPEEAVYVLDLVCSDGTLHRTVIPRGKISDIGDIVYKNNEAAGYDLTLACLNDNSDIKVYEYFSEEES